MTPKNWVQGLADYADARLNLEPRARNALVEAAYRSRAWEKYASPTEWADEYTRDRWPEEP